MIPTNAPVANTFYTISYNRSLAYL